ncbi:neuronal acetylcholine receptor subunit alpha-10-like [Mytilus californianus]|uniref:neuronal acetylcholine receptor subunit alpha-10-like n=1 Tax=Mytilus californianus TaxID=6549 RepID=UPI00224616CD|nr:neuronal acetylcholine receptor subunit alpha-10-like [Mytilus californianus]
MGKYGTVLFLLMELYIFGSGKIIKDNTDDDSKGTVTYGSSSVLNNLSTSLLANYGAGVRPLCPGYEKVNVTVDIAIRQLISLDEPEQLVHFNMWMRLGWIDCNLRWNPDDFNGTDSIVLPIDYIWKPDVTLYESISAEFYGFKDYRALINADGYVTYNFPTKIEALCPIDVAKFPFDSQVCELMFGSWSYNGLQLDIQSKDIAGDLSSMKENVEWIIEKAPVVRHEVYYGCCPGPFVDVTFYIHLKRKPAYYVTNIIVPSILITMVASFGFLLPVDSGEKVGLELTVMLAMSVFQLLVADKLPPSADSTPWIAMFFSFTLILSGGSSLWQVMVLNIHHRGDRTMSRFTKCYLLKPLAFITRVKLPKIQNRYKTSWNQDKIISKLFNTLDENRASKEKAVERASESEKDTDNSELWIHYALVLDRLGLVAFVFSFVMGCAYIFIGIINN